MASNNVMIVRHKLLEKLVALWKENQLVEKIDRVPLEFSPRRSQPVGRCCIHKERAVTKYKSLPLLGWDMSDETDELTPLSEYARQALDRRNKLKENILCVIDEACSSCVQVNYEVSNLCRGCVARSCYMNCPKGAVHFDKKTGQAHIDHDTCISCGICRKYKCISSTSKSWMECKKLSMSKRLFTKCSLHPAKKFATWLLIASKSFEQNWCAESSSLCIRRESVDRNETS